MVAYFTAALEEIIDDRPSMLDARLSETITERFTRQSKTIERQNALIGQLTADVAALKDELFDGTISWTGSCNPNAHECARERDALLWKLLNLCCSILSKGGRFSITQSGGSPPPNVKGGDKSEEEEHSDSYGSTYGDRRAELGRRRCG